MNLITVHNIIIDNQQATGNRQQATGNRHHMMASQEEKEKVELTDVLVEVQTKNKVKLEEIANGNLESVDAPPNEEEKVELSQDKNNLLLGDHETDGEQELKCFDIEKNDVENKGQQQKETEFVDRPLSTRLWEVFTTFWPLGFVAFGGPVATVALLRDHLVVQRDWMDEDQFLELFAIGQGLPGPTSTQLLISAAMSRAGPLGGLLAFFLFTLPGLVALTMAGVLIASFLDPNDPPFYLIGIAPAAISLVFKAIYAFTKKLDNLGIVLALVSACVAILINGDVNIQPTSSQYVFPSVLVAGSLVSLIDSRRSYPFGVYVNPSTGWEAKDDLLMKRIGIPLWVGGLILVTWAGILVLAIFLKDVVGIQNKYLDIFETMYRIGCLIFGGGHVVLPMLQSEVSPSWMSEDTFLQGLGLAQSLPGALFNFSSYLGAVYQGKNEKVLFFLKAHLFLNLFNNNYCNRHTRSSCCLHWSFWTGCDSYFWYCSVLGKTSTRFLVQGCPSWAERNCNWIRRSCMCNFVGKSN